MRHPPPVLSPRGQALMLAALSMLLLALMVAFSFNLSHALRTRTRLQQHSDAMAYSMAVLEARAFNYFAVSNRAIAATYVAMNSAHAYMAAVSVAAEMMYAGEMNFYQIAAMEAALCAVCRCGHCLHLKEPQKIAEKYGMAALRCEARMLSLEPAFYFLMGTLDDMLDTLHLSQRAVYTGTSQALRDGTSAGLDELRKINAPEASELAPSVGMRNAAEFTCAIDGMECTLPGKSLGSSLYARAAVMTEVANASRPQWPASRDGWSFPTHLNPIFLAQLMVKIPYGGATTPLMHHGTAKTVSAPDSDSLHEGSNPYNIGLMNAAHEEGFLFSWWKHGVGFFPYGAEVASSADGGFHTTLSFFPHHQFEGVNTRELVDCAGEGNCFMNFRADPDPAFDFGQPRVYSYVTGRTRMGDVKRAPWELNRSATVVFQRGQQVSGVKLAPEQGAAVSKALVYYHRLGDWREPPNMFNPFWRAKLHPFAPEEAYQLLLEAGNPDGALMATIPELSL